MDDFFNDTEGDELILAIQMPNEDNDMPFINDDKLLPLKTPMSFSFPFTPYSVQNALMKSIYECIETGKVGIFESPTGTGKSLSTLCSALQWIVDNDTREANLLQHYQNQLKEATTAAESLAVDWLEAFEKLRKLRQALDAPMLTLERRAKLLEFLHNLRNNVTNDVDLDELLHPSTLERATSTPSVTKIFYCSRTHSQLQQVFRELQRTVFAESISVVSLASRVHLCVNETVRGLQSLTHINDRCLEMQQKADRSQEKPTDIFSSKPPEPSTKRRKVQQKSSSAARCPYLVQQNVSELSQQLLAGSMDIEEMHKLGSQQNACPFYAARRSQPLAQLVLATYNSLLHASTRVANGIDIRDSVVVIDEAHNLMETVCEMHSNAITQSHIRAALSHVQMYLERYQQRLGGQNLLCIRQIAALLTNLLKFVKTVIVKNLPDQLMLIHEFAYRADVDHFDLYPLLHFMESTHFAHKLSQFVDKEQVHSRKSSPMFNIIAFLKCLALRDEHCKLCVTKSTMPTPAPAAAAETSTMPSDLDGLTTVAAAAASGKREEVAIKFLILSPGKYLRDIVEQCRSVILLGGTMQPIQEFKNQLEKYANCSRDRIMDFACSHVVPSQNILTLAVDKVEETLLDFRFQKRDSEEVVRAIGKVIESLSSFVPGGFVIFLPSYEYEEKIFQMLEKLRLWKRIREQHKRLLFREPRKCDASVPGSSLEDLMKRYAVACGSADQPGRAVMMCVIGAKLSEGINFSDHLCRVAIVIGLPYANPNDAQLKEQMRHLDEAFGAGNGKQFYEGSCMKAVNQAIGRSVRHYGDYASILLLDQRYTNDRIVHQLPKWLQKTVHKAAFSKALPMMKTFFEKIQQ